MSRHTRIKICGLTDPAAADAAVEAGADAAGLVFAAGSPREIDLDRAAAIRERIPPFVEVVCVFRDASAEDVRRITQPGDLVQLHGDEDESFITALGRPVIRGFPFDPVAVRRWDACPAVRGLLVDGPRAGSGATFDHAALAAVVAGITTPVILAGGLTTANVGAAMTTVRPFAVDVSSGVESAPGVKDPQRIHAFCEAVRRADAATKGDRG